ITCHGGCWPSMSRSATRLMQLTTWSPNWSRRWLTSSAARWSCPTMRLTVSSRNPDGRGLLVEIANDVADRGEGCLQRLSVYPNQHALETGDVVERRCPQLESPWSLLTARNQKDTGDTKR